MNRLNYFNSYQSKPGHHEDQLTRAYLVLLRYSFHAFAAFYDYCNSKLICDTTKQEKIINLNSLLESGWEIDTQKSNPVIGTDWLMSVLITDASLEKSGVTASERNARYDGIITFGSQLTMIIENKPRSGHVWSDQLNPASEGLGEETKLYCNPVCLEWKEIIKQLNHLLNIPTLSGFEKMMIEDFLSFIDQNFIYLNPYDSFHLCKGYPELIHRRIHNILKSIVIDENLVKYHHGWGFYIETPYKELQQIGLVFTTDEAKKSWWLELSLYFGDTQSQAIAFYKTNPSVAHLSKDWWWAPNFHVSFRSSNLVWFRDVPGKDRYIQFWIDNIYEIYQQKRDKVKEYLDWVKEEGIINITAQDEKRLDLKFYDTAMQTLNICPGFGAVYEITSEEAEDFDKKGELRKLLVDAIKEGLRIIGKDGSEFLKPI